jgi:AcrR family transcriptional regulator
VTVIQSARERARAEITQEIKDEARRQLAQDGAAALSLRAVARRLGMVSSALYRYFASRDELLTALIVDAYDAVGEAAERADRSLAAEDISRRWHAVASAIRSWALANPHEYALLYGSPVPGYAAPALTIGPASRVTLVLAGIVADAARFGMLLEAPPRSALGPALRTEAGQIAATAMPGVGPMATIRAVIAWTMLFGIVSFEVFGHLKGVIQSLDATFDVAVEEIAAFVGLPAEH